MKTALLIQHHKTPNKDNLQSFLTDRIHEEQFDCARIAVAYATVSGVRTLLKAFEKKGLKSSSWILGLDDGITQPGAIELLLSLDNSEVRVASYERENFRFHPKFLVFDQLGKTGKLLTLVGSANLTASALCGNSEALAILEARSEVDLAAVEKAWDNLWRQGHKPNKRELDKYKALYEKAAELNKNYKKHAAKKEKVKRTALVLASDNAEIDPAMADICWIECGNVTAMGRELEFKAEQGHFWGLNPSGGEPTAISITTSDGKNINLTMKYQENHMWRLQMNNNVPEVKAGLRPKNRGGKLGRSPYVAIFTRNVPKKTTDLKFIDVKGKEFSKLRKQTIKSGTLGKTIAREYGWCL